MFSDIFNQVIVENFNKLSVWFGATFNTEFWSLVGYTGLGVFTAILLAYFFPALRSFAGAAVIGMGGLWYGYHRGQASRDAEVARLKKAKAKKK